jgi:hypothetical protein
MLLLKRTSRLGISLRLLYLLAIAASDFLFVFPILPIGSAKVIIFSAFAKKKFSFFCRVIGSFNLSPFFSLTRLTPCHSDDYFPLFNSFPLLVNGSAKVEISFTSREFIFSFFEALSGSVSPIDTHHSLRRMLN